MQRWRRSGRRSWPRHSSSDQEPSRRSPHRSPPPGSKLSGSARTQNQWHFQNKSLKGWKQFTDTELRQRALCLLLHIYVCYIFRILNTKPQILINDKWILMAASCFQITFRNCSDFFFFFLNSQILKILLFGIPLQSLQKYTLFYDGDQRFYFWMEISKQQIFF